MHKPTTAEPDESFHRNFQLYESSLTLLPSVLMLIILILISRHPDPTLFWMPWYLTLQPGFR